MALITWIVWRDLYPATPRELGQVSAPDERRAMTAARLLFPAERHLRVQSAPSARVAKLELRPKRDSYHAVDHANIRRAQRRAHARRLAAQQAMSLTKHDDPESAA